MQIELKIRQSLDSLDVGCDDGLVADLVRAWQKYRNGCGCVSSGDSIHSWVKNRIREWTDLMSSTGSFEPCTIIGVFHFWPWDALKYGPWIRIGLNGLPIPDEFMDSVKDGPAQSPISRIVNDNAEPINRVSKRVAYKPRRNR